MRFYDVTSRSYVNLDDPVFKYFTKIDMKHVRPVEGYCQSAVSGTRSKDD